MIPEAGVKTEARRLGVDPLVVDRDHALGVVLYALSRAGMDSWSWVFKGGTCLRKAHFPEYRFSEDLDFTCGERLTPEQVGDRLTQIVPIVQSHGIRLLPDRLRIDDKSGGEEATLEVRIPYEGTVRRSGPPPNLQLHLSFGETMAFGVVSRPLLHPYSDAAELACLLPCYSLEEILVEKLRAICGQRRFAIARDIYDVWKVTAPSQGPESRESGEQVVNVEAVLRALPTKAQAVGVDLRNALDHLTGR